MSVADLSEMEQSVDQYFAAAKRYNNLIHHKQPVGAMTTRELARCAMNVFYAYKMPSNLTPDGKPRVSIPIQLAADVAYNLQQVLEGHIPSWMLVLQKPGAPFAHPKMRQDIGLAVAYKKLCDAGQISDSQSTKTVSDLYGVSTRRVQMWMKEYSFSEPSDWVLAGTDDAVRNRLIQDALPNCAARYKECGRGPSNARPHGKARRRLSAKV